MLKKICRTQFMIFNYNVIDCLWFKLFSREFFFYLLLNLNLVIRVATILMYRHKPVLTIT